MHIHILSIFPELFAPFRTTSLIGRAVENRLLQIDVTDIRSFAAPPHFHVDDYPYGGGPGMVMKPEPLAAAVESAKNRMSRPHIILLSAAGEKLTHERARELSLEKEIILICGRYEGVDQRIIEIFVDEEISIGDTVYMGGEVPAMALMEAVCRFLPEVIGNEESLSEESFATRPDGVTLLEGPQYTRPEVFMGHRIPEVLKSGDHARIKAWRVKQALDRTLKNRPDLIKSEGTHDE